ncbi:MAG: hypothetical protein HYX24_03015 [Candidatus Aenigmarchaeota archaeon]|nr:hypothetical protein [Candidatus Aenigmarchaeota archaeon]
MKNEEIGRGAFLLGLAIAVIAGILTLVGQNFWLQNQTAGLWVLAVLGLIVGFLNITGKEIQNFLLGAIALMLVGNSAKTLGIAGLSTAVDAFNVFVATAALVVALKEIYQVTKEK